MAVNYELLAHSIDVSIRPDELVRISVEFIIPVAGCMDPQKIADSVGDAIVILGDGVQLVKREKGLPRCVYCGKKNKADALECQFCGGHV